MAYVDSFVGEGDVQGIAVCIAVDGDGFDAHFFRCFDNATGDFTAVGN